MNILLSKEQVGAAMDELMEPPVEETESEEITASAPTPKVSPELLRKHAGKVLTTREAEGYYCRH